MDASVLKHSMKVFECKFTIIKNISANYFYLYVEVKVTTFRFKMHLLCTSRNQQKRRELEEEYIHCHSLYNYAVSLEKNQQHREAYHSYVRCQSQLEALQINCFAVCNNTFCENVATLLKTVLLRVPVCMGFCINEVRKVTTDLREVRKSDDAPSYKLKLSDIVTKFDHDIFLGRLTEEEHEALFPDSEPEQYADDDGDQRAPIATVPRRRKLLDKIPRSVRQLPLRPRCETKAFKEMMLAKQPWDRMKPLVQTNPLKVNWLDIVGYEDVKEELHSKLVDNIDRLREERKNCPNLDQRKQQTLSVLLYGPVGTGKTQLCDAIANEARQCVYIKCKSSDLLGKYRGESSKAIDLLFKMAAALGPSIIFLDECEDLLASRNSEMGQSRTDMSSVILQNMTTHKNVSFLCATNFPWSLDAGYIRRFASKHMVGLPNKLQRAVILKQLFGQIFSVITDEEYNQLASPYKGLSGSDIFQCYNCWTSALYTELRKATHFKVCPYRRNIVVPCSPDDADETVEKIRRPDIDIDARGCRATTFADLQKHLSSREWRTVHEKDLKLFRDYQERFGDS